MRLRRNAARDIGETRPVSTSGEVTELRPISDFKVCTICLVVNAAADAYCTACGEELPVPPSDTLPLRDLDATLAQQTREIERPAPGADEERESKSSAMVITPPIRLESPARAATASLSARWPMIMASVLVALGLIGSGTLGVLWIRERSYSHRTEVQRDAVRSELAATSQALRRTKTKLQSTTAIANQRKEVLRRARLVLAGVDRLLSNVDGMEQKSSSIQSSGSDLVFAAESTVDSMVALANYLIQTDAAYIDYGYEQQLIDAANGAIDNLRYQESVLSGESAAYDTASTRFGNVADAFSKAVRDLQRQLRSVSR
jgi:hypothetical protein